jgi:hypothetical protein
MGSASLLCFPQMDEESSQLPHPAPPPLLHNSFLNHSIFLKNRNESPSRSCDSQFQRAHMNPSVLLSIHHLNPHSLPCQLISSPASTIHHVAIFFPAHFRYGHFHSHGHPAQATDREEPAVDRVSQGSERFLRHGGWLKVWVELGSWPLTGFIISLTSFSVFQ